MAEDLIVDHTSKSSGHVYKVNITKLTCTCPDWRNRQAKVKGICKHIKEELEKLTGKDLDYVKVIKENNDALDFIEKYGEDVLETLKKKGICYEEHEMLYILE